MLDPSVYTIISTLLKISVTDVVYIELVYFQFGTVTLLFLVAIRILFRLLTEKNTNIRIEDSWKN